VIKSPTGLKAARIRARPEELGAVVKGKGVIDHCKGMVGSVLSWWSACCTLISALAKDVSRLLSLLLRKLD
jgi:hypothetical protein